MQRDGEKRDREQFMTAVTTHIRSLGRLDVGGGIVGAGRTSDLAGFFFFLLCVKRCNIVPSRVLYWGSDMGDFSGCLLTLLMVA